MTRLTAPAEILPKGIQRAWDLPNSTLGDLWDSIIIAPDRKTQLLSQAVVNFTVRPKVDLGALIIPAVVAAVIGLAVYLRWVALILLPPEVATPPERTERAASALAVVTGLVLLAATRARRTIVWVTTIDPQDLGGERGSLPGHRALRTLLEGIGHTAGQVTLRAEVPNPKGELLPGLYVRVRIEQAQMSNAIAIPALNPRQNQGAKRAPARAAAPMVTTTVNPTRPR